MDLLVTVDLNLFPSRQDLLAIPVFLNILYMVVSFLVTLTNT